jgi:hypothetical protein
MSVLMQMIAVNARLCDWETFVSDGRGTWSSKQPEKIAKAIFSQLSHVKVMELVVREYDGLAAQIRMELRELCNTGNASGNVRKNVQVLNDRLQGRLLAEEKFTRYSNIRKERQTGVSYERKAINEAVAGAKRKYQKD